LDKVLEIRKKFSIVEKENDKLLIIIEGEKKNFYLFCDKEVLIILNHINGINTFEIIYNILTKDGYNLTKEDLKEIIFVKLKKLFENDEQIVKNNYLFFRFTLLKRDVVKKIASIFSFIFKNKKFVILSFIFFIVLSIILIYHSYTSFNILTQSAYVLPSILLLSLFLHEIGHASACYTYGAKNGSIGFGFYLLTPVMYADVSDAWKLNKKERILIDIAGLYMEGLLMFVFFVIFLITKIDFFLYSSVIIVFNSFININPFLRFDGYWILSDLTNTYNLRESSNTKLIEFFTFKMKKINKKDIFLIIYGLVSFLFLIWFLFYMSFYNFMDLLNFPNNIYLYLKGWFINNPVQKINFWQISLPFAFYLILLSKLKQLFLLLKNILKK
jgi:putative peptide zinc metalloprotease protein